jgi:hypothetical protein
MHLRSSCSARAACNRAHLCHRVGYVTEQEEAACCTPLEHTRVGSSLQPALAVFVTWELRQASRLLAGGAPSSMLTLFSKPGFGTV